MNLAALTFADEVFIATKTSKCNVRQGEYQGEGGRARKLLQNRYFFPRSARATSWLKLGDHARLDTIQALELPWTRD